MQHILKDVIVLLFPQQALVQMLEFQACEELVHDLKVPDVLELLHREFLHTSE